MSRVFIIRFIFNAVATGIFAWLAVTQHRLWPVGFLLLPVWFALGYQYCLEKMQKNNDS